MEEIFVMVEKNEIMIRPMKDGEQKEIVRVGKRAFKLMEAWFVGTPKLAMVADYNGKIVQKSVDNPKVIIFSVRRIMICSKRLVGDIL